MKRCFALFVALMIVLSVVSYADEQMGFHMVDILGYRFNVPTDCTYNDGGDNGGYFIGASLNGPLFFMILDEAEKMTEALGVDKVYDEALSALGATVESSEKTTINGLQAVRWRGTHPIGDEAFPAYGITLIHDDDLILFLLDDMSDGSREDDENILSVIIGSLQMPSDEPQPQQTPLPVYDLSGMTFDELLALKEQINAALWASEEWQEVTVPVGVYEIGKDIPAGKWTISATPSNHSRIKHGMKLTDGGDVSSLHGVDETIYHKDYWIYSEGDPTEIHWDLAEGEFFQVEDSAVIFTPFAGLDLGFKGSC